MNTTSADAPHPFEQNVITLVLVSIAIGAALGYFSYLHTPQNRPRTSIVLHRNSLLPHQFAGPCSNCHTVEDVGPVAMNANTMHLFNLMPRDRELLKAGQRVEVPSLYQRLQTPAITRSDTLPHAFVGVCSNCHIVLDVKPTRAYMQDSMQKAYQPLIGGSPFLARWQHEANPIVTGGRAIPSHRRELYRNVTGYTALALFLFSCVYIVMRQLVRRDPARYKGQFDLKGWLYAHRWLSICFTTVATLHWYFSDRGNNALHISLLIVFWLTLAGFLLQSRRTHRVINKKMRLLHTQRAMFVALLVLLVVGHLFAGFS